MRRKFSRRRRRYRCRSRRMIALLLSVFLLFSLFCERQIPLLQTSVFEAALARHGERVIAKTVPAYLQMLAQSVSDDSPPDTYVQNQVQTALAEVLQKRLSRKFCTWVPVGSLTGLYLLNGHGVRVPIVLSAESTVSVLLEPEITSAGINRTRYALYLVVSVQIYSVSAAVSETVPVEMRYPVFETILDGAVPQVVTGRN